ncbi:MAG: NAD(P)/FAD-dependent oxidoreductase [Rhodospirillales bacterium]|nr:NAD(P)/FAD-dependent oxidoreductase [Rhodospirillales bacterium]
MKQLDAPVVVIGAGPAGLAAAKALADGGVGVLVVERDEAPGGLPRFCRHPGFGWAYTRRFESGPAFARRMLAALDPARVAIETRTSVLSLEAGPTLHLLSAEHGNLHLRPRAVVLATGIRERPRSARLVPGRRPERGVLTTGQLQQMVARGVPVRGRRAIVVGTEHVSFSVLLTARHAGLKVVAMAGPEDRVMSHAAAGLLARAAGIPIHLSTTVEDIEGSVHVEAVTLRGPDGTHRIACDTVVFTGDFVPDCTLFRGDDVDPATGGPLVDQFGRTNLPGVFAAGNVLRAVETSGWAANEGARVGANAAAYLDAPAAWRENAARIAAGPGVAYVVPQFHAPANGMAALPVSLRADRDMRPARLHLDADGAEYWRGNLPSARRLRRVAVEADAFATLPAGRPAEFRFD